MGRFESSRAFLWVVWGLRIVTGALFVMSGLVKVIDLWGFVFKIEEYLNVWGIVQPRSVVLMAAMLISGWEFVFGALLLAGCYKRVAPWALTLLMAVMLPLSAWLAIADPISDCGCFGDFWVVSNTVAFIKNILITAALILLILWNGKLSAGVYKPAIQWIVGAVLSAYVVFVGLYGYNVQPMLDFRPYPVGAALTTGNDDSENDPDTEDEVDDMRFIYEKDGEQREFTADNLPDSTWTFIDRTGDSAVGRSGAAFTVYDAEGNDATEEAIYDSGRELLLVIPEPRRIDISYTYFLNELKQWCDTSGVGMVCLIASDRRGVDFWKDVSMAGYEVYLADDTKLKELVRGTMALVELDNGRVKAKYTLSSVGAAEFGLGPRGRDLPERMAPRPGWWFGTSTGSLLVVLLALYLCQSVILAINSGIRRKYRKKSVNLHSETETQPIQTQNNHEKEHRSR